MTGTPNDAGAPACGSSAAGAPAASGTPAASASPASDAAGGAPSVVLGTAGHIDHGKSSLIKALTGTDPDRLAEEKRRGITIELGFAQLALPSGRTVGVVDVPGHERFVRQMVAGATGIDLALIVIAADDGVMPQTVEHLAVLELLGVRSGVVALTKTDLVDADWAEFMADEVRSGLAGTPFADAPLVPVSSRTGQGVPELLAALDQAAAATERTKDAGAMRMPVDRVFSVKGIGTVVTGTLWSGTVSPDDTLEVLPEGRPARVRSVQMHGHDTQQAPAGNRVAVSLSALGTDEVRPGDFLAAPGSIAPTDRFDAQLTYLDPFKSGKPFETGTRVHVAHGTREVLGRVLLMNGRESMSSGESLPVQIRLEEPLPVSYHDRFVVRSYSPVRVIGGGMVLAAHPRRRTTVDAGEQAFLDALAAGDAQGALAAWVARADGLVTVQGVADATGLPTADAARCLEGRLASGALVRVGGAASPFAARPGVVQKLLAALERALLTFHTANPDATGIAKEALRGQVAADLSPAAFDALLDEAAERGAVLLSGGTASHPKAGAGARQAEQQAAEAIAAILEQATGAPPELDALAGQAGVGADVARRALAALERDGRAVRISATRYYAPQEIERCRTVVAAHLRAHGPSPAADLKEAMGVSRKYAMPLLEHFDAAGLTRREGDLRSLAE